MELAGYVSMLLVGITLGLIGSGGAILTVPILVYLFEMPALIATSYSLFIVGVASLVGVVSYHRKKQVDYRTAVVFALPSFVGIHLARRHVLPLIPEVVFRFNDTEILKGQLVMIVFAVVMLLASVSMIRRSKPKVSSKPKAISRTIALAVMGFIVGLVAGFVGVGGGFLMIPALVLMAGIPMPIAVGTSLSLIAANSLVGFFGDLHAGVAMRWDFLMITTLTALVGILIGSYVARFVPASKLKPAFGYFVLAMGVYILLTQWFR